MPPEQEGHPFSFSEWFGILPYNPYNPLTTQRKGL